MPNIYHEGMYLGNPGVKTFNGRSGSVLPMAGDYTADQVNYDNNQTVKEKIDSITALAVDLSIENGMLCQTFNS